MTPSLLFVLSLALSADDLLWTEVEPIPAERKNHTPGWCAGPFLACQVHDSLDTWVTRQTRDGRLAPWTLVKNSGFSDSKWGNPVLSVGPRLYSIGHWGTSRTALVDAGGRPSKWKDTPTRGMGEPLLWGAGAVADLKKVRYLVHVGGFEYEGENFTKGRSQHKVFVAGLLPDGSVTAWRQTSPLPVVLMSPSAAFHDGWLYVFGGFSRKFAPEDKGTDRMVEAIYAGKVGLDGSIAEWKTLERKAPWTGMGIAGVVHEGWLYLAGGETAGDGAGTATAFSDKVARARLDGGEVGEWELLPTLPAATGKTPHGIIGDWFYLVGLSRSGKTPVYALRLPK